jgi:magnesium transporter
MARRRKNRFISRHRPRKSGLPPGTMPEVVEHHSKEKVTIHVLEYDELGFSEATVDKASDLNRFGKSGKVTWVNIDGIHNVPLIEEIGQVFNIHPLTLEDIVNTDQRPKFENYDEYDVIMMKMLFYERELGSEQLSIILMNNLVLTFQEVHGGDPFTVIIERIRQGKGRVRKCGADYLAYALLDSIVDTYFNILEKIGDRIEEIDARLVADPQPEVLETMHQLKREMIYLRKAVWPVREVVAGFERSETIRLSKATQVYLRDVMDHSVRVIETVESYRDLITGMMDIYLTGLSHKMNEVMKVLTIISTIFIPVTFIAGVYGMNFEYMPELRSPYGYWITWGIMLSIMLLLVYYFRRKKWL